MWCVAGNTRLPMPYHVQEFLSMQRNGQSKVLCFNVARCHTGATNTE
jgi:hypothetical protein